MKLALWHLVRYYGWKYPSTPAPRRATNHTNNPHTDTCIPSSHVCLPCQSCGQHQFWYHHFASTLKFFRTYFRLYTNQRCICEVQPIRWPNLNNHYQWLYGPDHWSYMKWHPEYNSSISRDYRIAGSFHRHVVSKNGEKWADFENLDFL